MKNQRNVGRTMRYSLFFVGLLLSSLTAFADQRNDWRIASCGDKDLRAIGHIRDLLALEKTRQMVVNGRYVASTRVQSATQQSVGVSAKNAYIEWVQVNDSRVGFDENGQYVLQLGPAEVTVSVCYTAEANDAQVSLVGIAQDTELTLDSDIDDFGKLDFRATLHMGKNGNVRVSGFTDRMVSLVVQGQYVGEEQGSWSHYVFAADSATTVSVTAVDFYDSVAMDIPIVKPPSAGAVSGISGGSGILVFDGAPLWRSFGSTEVLEMPRSSMMGAAMRKLADSPAADEGQAAAGNVRLSVSHDMVDLEAKEPVYVFGELEVASDWRLKVNGERLSRGSGRTFEVEIPHDDELMTVGMNSVTLSVGKLTKSTRYLGVRAGALAATYSRPVLFHGEADSIVITPSLTGATFSLVIYDRNWYPVYNATSTASFTWKGKNDNLNNVARGVYYSVVTATLNGAEYNNVQTVLVAPRALIPAPTVSIASQADTVYHNDTTLYVTYTVNGKSFVDTLDPRVDTIFIRDVTRFGVTGSDTVVVVYDTVPPQVTVNDTQVVEDTLYTRDTVVTFTYEIDGVTMSVDTVLPEGIHEIIIFAEDGAGNIGSDTVQIIVSLQPPFPDITIASPGVLETTFKPAFVVRYRDRATTLNLTSLTITLDGVDVKANFTVTADSAVWFPTDAQALANGSHALEVSITNAESNTKIETRNFIISRVIATPSATPTNGPSPLTVAFTTEAIDPTGTVEYYIWDFDGDNQIDTIYQVPPLIRHTYVKPGSYNATLRVISNTGQIDTAVIPITVTPPSPTAFASARPTNGGIPLKVGFTGWGSTDVGYIKYHEYDFDGDGTYDTLVRTGPDTVVVLESNFDSTIEGWTPGGNSGSIGRVVRPEAYKKVWTSRDYRSTTSGLPIRGQGGSTFTPTANVSPYHQLISPRFQLPADTAFLEIQYYYHGSTSYIQVDTGQGDTAFTNLTSIRGSGVDTIATFRLGKFAGKSVRLRLRYTGYISDANKQGWDVCSLLVYTGSAAAKDTVFFDPGDGSVKWDNPGVGAERWRVAETVNTPFFGKGGWLEPDTSSFTYGASYDAWITSPSVALASGLETKLTFWHYMHTADNADGGVVQVSTDGTTFTTVAPDSGYPGTIVSKGDAYTDTLSGQYAEFDLSSYAGNSIQVRFRFYSNATNVSRGWLIDNVKIHQVIPGVSSDTTDLYANSFDAASDITGWTASGEGARASYMGQDFLSNQTDTCWSSYNDSTVRYYSNDIWFASPTFSIPGTAVACTLSFWSYLRGGYAYVQVDTGNGFDLNAWSTSGYRGDSTYNVVLTPYIGTATALRFLYRGYNGGNDQEGWRVDNILLRHFDAGDAAATLLDETGVGTGWSVADSGLVWSRQPRYVVGYSDGWLEFLPDSTRYPKDTTDSWIESPEIFLYGKNLALTFDQYATTDYRYDGCIVEIKRQGGQYTALTATGVSQTTLYWIPPGYTAAPRVFTGDARFGRPRFDLTRYAGNTVQVRFRFVGAGRSGNSEWIIDNLRIFDTDNASHVTYTYGTVGTHQAVVKITDNYGGSATAPLKLTEIRAGAAGTPSAFAIADTTYGPAPLTVQLTGWGTDSDGSIVSYDWDFDGDGSYDTSLSVEATITHVYDTVGTYYPTFRVLDDDGTTGNTSQDILRIQSQFKPTMTVEETDQTFTPSNGESVSFKTVVGGTAMMRMIIVDTAGTVVSNLVDWGYRSNSTYTDTWSGLYDNGGAKDGDIVPVGLYFGVLEYVYDGDTLALDLSKTTGGVESELGQVVQYGAGAFKPLSDSLLPVNFSLDKAYYVTLFTGYYAINKRVRTLYEKVLFPAGTYTVYWDGLADNGRWTPPTPSGGGATVVAGWKYTLPGNAVYVAAPRPTITFVSADPNYESPFSQSCSLDSNGIRLSYTLDQNVALVEGLVIDPVTTTVVAALSQSNVTAGANTLFWDGGLDADSTAHADAGIYRFGVRATTAAGACSLYKYTLVRIVP